MSEKCSCGHKKEDHENGTGNCKACDLNAGYGGNDSCSHFHVRPPERYIPPPTLSDRVAALEKELADMKRKLRSW